jgi:hypothetical protein
MMASAVFESIGRRGAVVLSRADSGSWERDGKPVPWLSFHRPNWRGYHAACINFGPFALYLALQKKTA